MPKIKIAQSSKALGDDYWNWSVWIDGSGSELGQIQKVVWKLHPTFPQPVVTRSDPKAKFRLDSAGWGVFMIAADVYFKSGRRLKLTHMLEFAAATAEVAPKKKATKQRGTPRVMLSFAATDVGVAEELRKLLKSAGAEIVEATRGRRGLPASAMVREAVQQSDAVIAVHDEANPSRWVQAELEQAKLQARPVLSIKPSADAGDVRGIMQRVASFLANVPRK